MVAILKSVLCCSNQPSDEVEVDMVFASLAARCKRLSPAKQFDVQQKCWEAVNEAYRDELLQR